MREGLEDLVGEVLAPSIYEIRLHEDDLARLRPIENRIIQQIGVVLDQELKRLERKRRLRGFGRGPRFVPAQDSWEIALVMDPSEELQVGHFEVVTDLGRLCHDEMHTQIRTISREGRLDTQRREITADTRGRSSGWAEGKPQIQPDVLAAISYEDRSGAHEFLMKRKEIVIGRRDEESWADLQLDAPQDIAPEHARIRYRREATLFEIKDLTGKGTAVDGRMLPWEGAGRQTPWRPLPFKALIELARGIIVLTFERIEPKT